MNIYLLSQTAKAGYNTFDSAVVVAESEQAARQMHPRDCAAFALNNSDYWGPEITWCHPEQVVIEPIGQGRGPARVVCASFNAA